MKGRVGGKESLIYAGKLPHSIVKTMTMVEAINQFTEDRSEDDIEKARG